MKNLGVIFDQSLNWKEHIGTVKKKCYSSISRLYRIKKVLSKENKLVMVDALVFTHIRYACTVYLNNKCKNNLYEINKIIRLAARFILNKTKYDSISEHMCKDLEFLLPENLVIYETLIFAYKCTFLMNEGYFVNYLNFDNHTIQNTRNSKYVIPNINVNSFWGRNTFMYNAVYQWLNLPNNVYDKVESLHIFKKTIMSFLLTKQNKKFTINDDDDDSIDYIECIDFVINNYK